MARPTELLGLFFVAALTVSFTCSASSAAPTKKSPKRLAMQKPNDRPQTLSALPPAAALAAPQTEAAVAVPPVASAATPAQGPAPAADAAPVAPVAPVTDVAPAVHPRPATAVNPYASRQPVFAPIDPRKALNEFLYDVKMSLPRLPMEGQSLLPVIKTVHPTGEKPLVVVSFKCPTEMIGVTPLPTKLLHDLVNAGMDTVNKSNLLAFNMQQVCQ